MQATTTITKEDVIKRVEGNDMTVLNEISRHRLVAIVKSGAFDQKRLSEGMWYEIIRIYHDAISSY